MSVSEQAGETKNPVRLKRKVMVSTSSDLNDKDAEKSLNPPVPLYSESILEKGEFWDYYTSIFLISVF
jgi:hypothetical protein